MVQNVSRASVPDESWTPADLAGAMIIAALLIALLVVGREILEPLVIAGLLAFILSPFIRKLRNVGLGRTPSVLVSVLLALGLLTALGAVIGMQLTQLAGSLPTYETNLRTKLRSLKSEGFASGVFERASGTLKDLEAELNRPTRPDAQRPIPVEVKQPDAQGLEAIANLVKPLLSPLTMSALVVLFLIFILLQREDIRDRFLRLAGTGDLHRSTEAMNDAGTRLSRYFLMQTLLNAGFGTVIAIGLLFIGVPNALLWGIFAGLMRFVPFIGGLIAAFFPLALAAAVDPGWTMAISVAAMFIVAEPLAGHVIEPLLYGQHTGLSPVAIVIASLFWTLAWGPVGLLLATPLTVCLVVLGTHVKALGFIQVLLGDEPALEPHERFYQRLLAGDDNDAADLIEEVLGEKTLIDAYDQIALPALRLAGGDQANLRLPLERQVKLRDTVAEIVEDLSDAIGDVELPSPVQSPKQVRLLAGRTPLDDAAIILLRQLLANRGVTAETLSLTDGGTRSTALTTADVVVISHFGLSDRPAYVRHTIRRLRKVNPKSRIVLAQWLVKDWASGKQPAAPDEGAITANSFNEVVDACVQAQRLAGDGDPDPGQLKGLHQIMDSDLDSPVNTEPVSLASK